MAFSSEKMRDEKLERDARLDDELAGEVGDASRLTRQVLWKMDVRHASRLSALPAPLTFAEYCLCLRCCFSAHSLIAPTWATPKS